MDLRGQVAKNAAKVTAALDWQAGEYGYTAEQGGYNVAVWPTRTRSDEWRAPWEWGIARGAGGVVVKGGSASSPEDGKAKAEQALAGMG